METLKNTPTETFVVHSYEPTIQRATTELFVASQSENVDTVLSLHQAMPREKSLWKYLLCSILVLTLSIIALYYGYSSDKQSKLKVYNSTVYSFLFLILCNVFIILDYTEKFELFQTQFEIYGIYYFVSFILIAFIDYILIGLQEDALITGLFIIVLIETLYYIALLLFFCTFMSYWKTWSFHCCCKEWIHSLLYLSIIGALFLFICRWLHPPSNKHWHRKHKINAILSSVISILTLLFLFCVVLGGIGICLFASFAQWTSQFGLSIAFISFICLSFLIMLTPLAPGSIIDACGGFIFVVLLVPSGYCSFFTAWFIALVSIVILHYCGACVQWWIGTWRCIQVWANMNLPIEMLAVSDAVLRDANFFIVGLVGYIFLDTANGLNQGRINMAFFTQLFSEWPAIPNALGLVSFGATIAASGIGLEGYDWTLDAVPLLIIFSSVVQAIGFSFATNQIAQAVDGEKYWKSREKWQMMQYFNKEFGYFPTMNGWENDVFNLGNNVDNVCDEFSEFVLYDKVEVIHQKYTKNRDKSKDAQKRLDLYQKYLNDLCKVREIHYGEFRAYIPKAVDKNWLIYQEKKNKDKNVNGYFEGDGLPLIKQYLYYTLVMVLIIAFWASFYGFYWTFELSHTVTNGINVLKEIEWYWYSCLVIFVIILIFINHVQIIRNSKSFYSALCFVFTGCKIHCHIETKFQTPEWIKNKDDYRE